MNRTRLKMLLVKHEGLRLRAYKDTTGHTTVGVGRNLDDLGLSEEEAQLLLDNDINRVHRECMAALACFGSLDEARQHVLLSMAFNLGIAGLLTFKKMLDAVERHDFDRAAEEMLASRWATQVGQRAKDLASMMRGEVV